MDIDSKDRKIINSLREDARKPIREIAKETKIRPSTVHVRIQKLIESDVIKKFTIQTDDKALKEDFIVFILINAEQIVPDAVFQKNTAIKEVFGITGEYDLIMKCKFGSIDEMNKFILKFRKMPQVKNTLTMIGTTKIKETV